MIGRTNSSCGNNIDISNLTATAEDITSGKTAYTSDGLTTGINTDSADYKALLNGKMTDFVSPKGVTLIRAWCFRGVNLKSAYISHGVTQINNGAFYVVATLTTLFLPNTLTYIETSTNPFNGCTNLTNVTLENGFKCNKVNLSVSTKYSHDTILSMFEALADRTGSTAYTLTLGTTNLDKMTDAEKAIATAKNWTLA